MKIAIHERVKTKQKAKQLIKKTFGRGFLL